MNILVLSAGFLPALSHGGVPFATYELCKYLSENGFNIKVVAVDRNGKNRLNIQTNNWLNYKGLLVCFCKTLFLKDFYCYSIHMKNIVDKEMNWCDIIISSGTLWIYPGLLAYRFARKYNKPHIVYLHGLLDEWTLKYKWKRKRLCWLYQGRYILENCQKIVALTDYEKLFIKKLNIKTQIEVIPNGVEIKNSDIVHNREQLERRFPFICNKKYILYMGRIFSKKGVDILLNSLGRVKENLDDIVIVFAGYIDKEYNDTFYKLVEDNKLSEKVFFIEKIYGEEKYNLLKNAYFFILTSYSEGLPMAIIESLSTGTPVLISDKCNVPEVKDYKAGWIVPCNVDSISDIMKRIINNEYNLKEYRINAFKLAKDKFSKVVVTNKTLKLINDMLSQHTL